MTDLEKIRLWEHLKTNFISKILDDKTKKLYYKTFLIKATQEFGFNPERCIIAKNKIELDDWEKEFVEDINKAKIYEVDTRKEKREQTNKEAFSRMVQFIDSGGIYSELPDYLQNDHTKKLYLKALNYWLDKNLKILEK